MGSALQLLGVGTRPVEDSRSGAAASKPAVLVVEDDFETQLFMKMLLGRQYEVFLAASGEEARSQLLDHPGRVRIVLMDLSLKGLEDGLMITRGLRSDDRFRALPIIAVTAHVSEDDRKNSLRAGCNDYVAKPFEPGDLLSRMKQFL